MEGQHCKTVAIIGGGFCGMLTAVQLIRRSVHPLKLVIINAGYPFGKGVAYSAHTSTYLLNVRAINMSAFPDEKEHFLNWVYQHEQYSNIDRSLIANVYMPRKLYGAYLSYVWDETITQKKPFIEVTLLQDIATDVHRKESGFEISLTDNAAVAAGIVVLATGNDTPRHITIRQPGFYTSEKYFPNPWLKACTEGVEKLQDIFIVGNGLTMVDTVLGLHENGFRGTIHTVSPNGFNLLPHKYNLLVYNKILEDLPESYTLHNMFGLVKQHAKRLHSSGIGVHLIIDALRPYSQQIWQSLSITEKKKFLRRLSPYWNALRHRIPLHIFEFMQDLRIRKRLIANSGRLVDVVDEGEKAAVTIANADGEKQRIMADRVINCTGPESNILKSSNPLISTLAARQLITADELKLGIHANPATGEIIGDDAPANSNIFTIGGNLKGLLWESTAAPELRVQAQNLAITILERLGKTNATLAVKDSFDTSYIE